MTITYQELCRRHEIIEQRAAHVRRLIIARAQATCRAAGIDPGVMGTAGHNAMIDFRAGKPWPGVNYPLLRRARWIMGKSFAPGQVSRNAWSRLYDEWRTAGFAREPEAQESHT